MNNIGTLPVKIGEIWENNDNPNFVFLVLDINEAGMVPTDYAADGLSIHKMPSNVSITPARKFVIGYGIDDYHYVGKLNELNFNGKKIIMGENDE